MTQTQWLIKALITGAVEERVSPEALRWESHTLRSCVQQSLNRRDHSLLRDQRDTQRMKTQKEDEQQKTRWSLRTCVN